MNSPKSASEGTAAAGRSGDQISSAGEIVHPEQTGVSPPRPLRGLFQSESLLETCRTRWQHGEWSDLIAVALSDIEHDRDRGKIVLLIAAAYAHEGDMSIARRCAEQAIAWGCSRRTVAQVLASTVENTLARAASALEEPEEAAGHFETAIRLVEPRADTSLLGKTRRIRETARMGLLPDAAKILEAELGLVAKSPVDHEARLTIFDAEVQVLKSELSLALQRGQLFNSKSGDEDRPPEQRSVSQLGQDVWVLERCGFKRGGYFVEFGASDGVLLSNTFLLERDYGWRGICADPNPAFFEQLKRNRTCTVSDACIAGRTGDEVEFILADVYGGINTFADADKHASKRAAYRAEGHVIRLKTVSLDDLLTSINAPRTIDYISIDTEGNEYDILESFPFEKWTIRCITVEHNFTAQRDRIQTLLAARGYKRTEVKWDDWYELQEKPNAAS